VLRLVDGRRGPLLAQDVEAVVDESGELMVAEHARVLALDAPHVERLVRTAAGRRTCCSRFASGG
jgi:hypothetical protein